MARWELVQSGLSPCFPSFRVAALGCLMFIILDPSFSHAFSLFVCFPQESELGPVPYPGWRGPSLRFLIEPGAQPGAQPGAEGPRLCSAPSQGSGLTPKFHEITPGRKGCSGPALGCEEHRL